MNQKIEEQLKQYLKEIRLLLPIYGKEERKFIRDLRDSIAEFIDEKPYSTWDDIIDHFEPPQDVVYNYLSSLDQPQLCKRISLRKTIVRAIAIITVMTVIALGARTYFYYDLYKEVQQTIVTKEITIIE